MKKTLLTLLTAGVFLTAATPVLASGSSYGTVSKCQVIYGGGETCQQQISFTLTKMVQAPNGQYVKNLSANDAHFNASSNVTFKITVKNTGDKQIKNLSIVDTFPQYLSFVSGPGKSSGQDLSFTIDSLNPGEERSFTVVAKTADAATLPQNVTCVVNEVKGSEPDGHIATDSSQVCIQKPATVPTNVPPKVYNTPPMKTTPNTGPEMLSLIALIPTGAAGFFLRKKSK